MYVSISINNNNSSFQKEEPSQVGVGMCLLEF